MDGLGQHNRKKGEKWKRNKLNLIIKNRSA